MATSRISFFDENPPGPLDSQFSQSSEFEKIRKPPAVNPSRFRSGGASLEDNKV